MVGSAVSGVFGDKKMELSGWGNFPRVNCQTVSGREDADLQKIIAEQASVIGRGNGRAYGDAAVNLRATALMRAHDRILDFDTEQGIVHCEAGLLLSDLLGCIVPRGWFPPVTPGTRFVTIGGMIAADVHEIGRAHV